MDNINVQIDDYELVKTDIINNIKISVGRIELFTSITLCVSLFTNKILIDNKFVVISGDDYNAWGNDDRYIVNYVLNYLNLHERT